MERICRGCGARGAALTQEAHRAVCDRADVVETARGRLNAMGAMADVIDWVWP